MPKICSCKRLSEFAAPTGKDDAWINMDSNAWIITAYI